MSKIYYKSTEMKKLPNVNKLYLKVWQSNNYYPIWIAEKTANGWEHYYLSVSGNKKCKLTYTDKSFLYMLQNNYCLVTDTMTDEFKDETIFK